MPVSPPFPPAFFGFLRDLKVHNDRDWFRTNQERYERDVKEPALAFVAAMAAPLRRISPFFVADPRPVGGSMFRIHRDTRFARDKSPYKTHVGLQFRHEQGKDAHAPCFYLHLEPGNVFLGAGIWHPDARTQRRIREAIAGNRRGWTRAISGKAFREAHEFVGESLKRPPPGFDAGHPSIDDLKRKDFIAVKRLTQRDAAAADFAHRVIAGFRTAGPLVRFLCAALELQY